MPRDAKDWQALPFEASDTDKLGWLREMAISTGTTWVEDQTNSTDIEMGINYLGGRPDTSVPSSSWSPLSTGNLKRGFREVIESLSDIRLTFAGYQTKNRAFLDYADMMNKVAQQIYLRYFVDRSLRAALQFGGLTGMGALSPYYTRGMFGAGRGEFVFEPLSQLDCLPVQLPRDRDYQKAYAVTLAKIRGVAESHARFPAYQAKLRPFAKNKYLKGGESGRQYRRSRWALHSMSQDLEQYCDIFYTYILDLRINDQPWGQNDDLQPLPMGQPGTSWYYEVPFVGQTITRWEDGKMRERAATDEDCRVYPRRRLQISCENALMYDGPAFDWHGMTPLVPFYLDDYAWDGTGNSLFTGTATLQCAMDDLVRSMYRIAMARVRTSKSYNTDISTPDRAAKLSSKQAESIDPFACDATYGVDGDTKEPVMRPLMPEWCYEIPQHVFAVVDMLGEAIKQNLGLDQVEALQKVRANIQDPAQLLEMEGPLVTGTSRSMEQGFRLLGCMTMYNILQYMPTGVIIQTVGVDQVPQTVFDYDPSSLIPAHMPGEETTRTEPDELGVMVSTPVPSALPQDERARQFADNLEYTVAPHSLHEIAQSREKLNLLAVMQRGLPIDPETLASKFDVPNWGSLDGSTIQEKLVSWAEKQVEIKARVDALAQELGLVQPQDAAGGAPTNGGGASAPSSSTGGNGQSHGPTGNPRGRPQTYKQAPRLRQKGINNSTPGRPVISTSG